MSSQTHTADNTITLTKCPGQTEDSMRSPITSHSKESLNVCQREKICCWVPEKNPDHTSSKKCFGFHLFLRVATATCFKSSSVFKKFMVGSNIPASLAPKSQRITSFISTACTTRAFSKHAHITYIT